VDGKVHALPGFAWNINLNVNVGLLRKYGWEGPVLNGPGNAYSDEEYTAFLTKVKETVPADVWPYVMQCGNEQGDYGWWQHFWGYGGKLFDADGTVADDHTGMIKGYNYLLGLVDKGLMARGVASMQATDPNKMFFSGKSIVGFGHKFHAKQIQSAIEEGVIDAEYEVMPIPYPSENGDKGFTANGGTGFIFFAQDKAEQEGASEWIQYVMSDEWWPHTVKGSGQFPLQKSMADANLYEGDEYQTVVSQMLAKFESGDFGLAHPKYQQIRVALSQAGQKIFSGQTTVEKAVEQFYAEVEDIISE
jgi:ABC-type glycerol-3-phosphate transport system substrate-binding protein